jgi:hypothetical protein
MKPTLSLISILLALSGIIATAGQRSGAGSATGNVSCVEAEEKKCTGPATETKIIARGGPSDFGGHRRSE